MIFDQEQAPHLSMQVLLSLKMNCQALSPNFLGSIMLVLRRILVRMNAMIHDTGFQGV
jgi:hypothetical protein